MTSGPHALISVYDKTGLVEMAQAVRAAGYAILSTGGTAAALEGADLPVRQVSDYTGFPEIMSGRVKTLHPKIHGGLLARRDDQGHYAAMVEHEIESIDLVIVNLYPFVETVLREGVTRAEAIEQIDIGGPSMIRAAAKNHDFVCVVCDPSDYEVVMRALKGGAIPVELRRKLAAKAFSITADYDTAISCYIAGEAALPDVVPPVARVEPAAPVAPAPVPEPTPEPEPVAAPEPAPVAAAVAPAASDGAYTLQGELAGALRYGENPHQAAAFYRVAEPPPVSVAGAEFLGANKELSYNNILDLEAALALIREFSGSAACAILKHNNPCGAAQGANLAAAFCAALECDPVSAFGSIVACNQEIDRLAAQQIAKPGNFVEALIAPAVAADALEILRGAKFGKNLRILVTGPFVDQPASQLVRSVSGGFLVQEEDVPGRDVELAYVTSRRPSGDEIKALRFAWSVVKHVRSNAIVLARGEQTVGIGAGQMSRVDSVRISVDKAGDRAAGAVLASDAFFPFPDGLVTAAEAGVTAVIQPGGSRKDAEVIAAADEHDVAMVLTGVRHFKH